MNESSWIRFGDLAFWDIVPQARDSVYYSFQFATLVKRTRSSKYK